MARVRWVPRARRELHVTLLWLVTHYGDEAAARASADVAAAVENAAARPDGYAWVGSVIDSLGALATDVRRVITRTGRLVVYYHHDKPRGVVRILAVRGAGQRPPSVQDLTVDAAVDNTHP